MPFLCTLQEEHFDLFSFWSWLLIDWLIDCWIYDNEPVLRYKMWIFSRNWKKEKYTSVKNLHSLFYAELGFKPIHIPCCKQKFHPFLLTFNIYNHLILIDISNDLSKSMRINHTIGFPIVPAIYWKSVNQIDFSNSTLDSWPPNTIMSMLHFPFFIFLKWLVRKFGAEEAYLKLINCIN